MKLQFDANQDFQLDAINAAVDLFKGQPAGVSDFAFSKASSVGGTFLSVVVNNLILDDETILKNLQAVQQKNGIEESKTLDGFHFSIEMDGITEAENFNQAYIEVKSIKRQKNRITAKLKIDANAKEGVIKKDVTVKVEDNLFEKSNRRDLYKDGFIVSEIDAESIGFNNGLVLCIGQKQGGLTDEIMRYEIESTVKNHFEKEKRLKEKGIKVLTLFFIDRVANYRGYQNDTPDKGKFARWFEEIYEDLRKQAKYKGVLEYKAQAVHNGYFAQDKKGNWKDSNEGRDTKDDDSAYQLIMKDKERLLDINEPLRFIFSHSALREGWDNPNVFQICTLNETRSTLKKRQEIGRGLRLPVNQDGKRVFDESINVLTVTANQHYEEFAMQLQAEIEAECGVRFDGGRIKDKNKKKKIKLTKNLLLDKNFKELWEKIKHKTRYSIDYDTAELVKRAAKKIMEIVISKPKLVRSKADIKITSEAVKADLKAQQSKELFEEITSIPDILSYIQNKTRLTRDTIYRILIESGRIDDVFVNPQQFMDKVCSEITTVLKEMIVDGIKYEKIAGSYWDQLLFDSEELYGYLDGLDLLEVRRKDKTVYDYVQIDSKIERDFAKACEDRDDIKFYFKLPFWFKIETPLGTYTPDWALVYEGDKKVYFVAETKGTNRLDDLTPNEQYKIKCGRKHFENFEDVEFKAPVTKLSDFIA